MAQTFEEDFEVEEEKTHSRPCGECKKEKIRRN